MERSDMVISGFGGQGVLFVGYLLAYAGMLESNYICWIPSYGVEMRGGTAHCFVTIADKEVSSPIFERPSAVMVFNNPSLEKFETAVIPGGHLFINSSLVDVEPKRTDLIVHKIPASDFANELGNSKVANIILLGALIQATEVVLIDNIYLALQEILSEKKKKMLPLNYEALKCGMSSLV